MKGRRPNEQKKFTNKTKQNKNKTKETKKPRNQTSETNEAKGGFCGRIPPVVSGGSKKERVVIGKHR